MEHLSYGNICGANRHYRILLSVQGLHIVDVTACRQMEESGEAGEAWQSLEDTWTELGLFLKVTLLADSVRPLTHSHKAWCLQSCICNGAKIS